MRIAVHSEGATLFAGKISSLANSNSFYSLYMEPSTNVFFRALGSFCYAWISVMGVAPCSEADVDIESSNINNSEVLKFTISL